MRQVVKGVLNDNRFAVRLPVEIQRVVVDYYLYAFRSIPGMYYLNVVLDLG